MARMDNLSLIGGQFEEIRKQGDLAQSAIDAEMHLNIYMQSFLKSAMQWTELVRGMRF